MVIHIESSSLFYFLLLQCFSLIFNLFFILYYKFGKIKNRQLYTKCLFFIMSFFELLFNS
nr:MAG TPA: hypothetical protein [Caudoviricetes sp.]